MLKCYITIMITSFGNRMTEDLFHGIQSKDARKFPRNLLSVAYRKLDMINAAQQVGDLRTPPGNRLEALKRDLSGLYSIRVNDQHRIIFKIKGSNAEKVQIVDYHR